MPVMSENPTPACFDLVAMLAQRFDPAAARGQEGEIQFFFSGAESGACYLRMTKTACTFHLGEALYPKLTLRVDCDVWKAILRGELRWEKAMMERRFLATGSFPLLAQMPRIFKFG